MGDILIRNVSKAVKTQLVDSAKINGRSLSDEIRERLARSLVSEKAGEPPKFANAYEAIRSAFVEADALMSDDEHARFMGDVDRMRHSPPRPVSDFE